MPTTRLIALLATLLALVVPTAAQALVPTTTRVVNASGQELNGDTIYTDVSRDGRWQTFASTATNAGSANGLRQVYLADRATGELRLLSKAADGKPGNGRSSQPSISGDGRFVAFQTAATNLAPGVTNVADDVLLFDRTTGTLRRLSTSLTGNDGEEWSRDPRVSADGTIVVFTSVANNLVAGDANFIDVFAVPTAGGPIERVSARADGTTANASSVNGAASDRGRFVAFATDATDLVTGDTNAKRDIVVLDRLTGERTRASVSSANTEANGDANYPSITADGCLVVFNDTATNLVSGDDKTAAKKTFVRNRCTGNTEFASLRADDTQGAVTGLPPAISDDGCTVAMVSAALTPGAPAAGAVVLRDRCQGATLRVDMSSFNDLGNGGVSGWPRLSAGTGRYVSFDSASDNLVKGDANKVSDPFVRDRANAQAPVAALDVRTDGAQVVADASTSRDLDGTITAAKIGWGDGNPEDAGLQATHTYQRGGTYSVTLVVTDSDGLVATTSRSVTIAGPTGLDPGATSPAQRGPAKQVKLVLSGATLSRSAFAPVPARGKATGKRGTNLTLTSSAAATLELRFERVQPGHKAGRTCKSGAGHARQRCTARRNAGSITARLLTGRNTIALSGRLGAHALPVGRYRLILTARTGDGRVSGSLTRNLTITKEHS